MTTPTPLEPEEPAWLHPHVHEPNPAPPSTDTTIRLSRPDNTHAAITPAELAALPQQSAHNCYIVSTGHGTSGPFRFEGVTLDDLFTAYGITTWHYTDVISADGFGTRVHAAEIPAEIQHKHPNEGTRESQDTSAPIHARPILLALTCNGKPLTRQEGLVRLVVPHENDDALRQVKWVARIEIH